MQGCVCGNDVVLSQWDLQMGKVSNCLWPDARAVLVVHLPNLLIRSSSESSSFRLSCVEPQRCLNGGYGD